jgi:hypothetical protein
MPVKIAKTDMTWYFLLAKVVFWSFIGGRARVRITGRKKKENPSPGMPGLRRFVFVHLGGV